MRDRIRVAAAVAAPFIAVLLLVAAAGPADSAPFVVGPDDGQRSRTVSHDDAFVVGPGSAGETTTRTSTRNGGFAVGPDDGRRSRTREVCR